jgi:formyl-CoA transferase
MFEPVLQLLASAAVGWTVGADPPRRVGSRVTGGAVRNVYRTGDDEWMVLSATTPPQLTRLLGLMTDGSTDHDEGPMPSLAPTSDPEELDRAVRTWIAAQTRSDVLDALERARVPAAPVNDLASIWDDAHVRARGSLVSLQGAGTGPLVFVAPAPKLGATPGSVTAPGPGLGAHNAEVYSEWLGLDAGDLAGLRDRRTI